MDEEHVETALEAGAGVDETGVDSDQSPMLLHHLLLQDLQQHTVCFQELGKKSTGCVKPLGDSESSTHILLIV